jgi:hypothetical protein
MGREAALKGLREFIGKYRLNRMVNLLSRSLTSPQNTVYASAAKPPSAN